MTDAQSLKEFRSAVGDDGLITEPEQLRTYECDGLTNYRVLPSAVLLPKSTEQVQRIVRICHDRRIPFVARGSGTGLSGGSLPVEGGVVIGLSRLNHILEIDIPNGRVVVERGNPQPMSPAAGCILAGNSGHGHVTKKSPRGKPRGFRHDSEADEKDVSLPPAPRRHAA